MLEIKPIETKEEQEALCRVCGIPFDADCLAYAARVDEQFVGICQFRIFEKEGKIFHLSPAPETDDREAMFIMGRAAMNFIDLCGVHFCRIEKDAADEAMIRWLGFTEDEGGWIIDTEAFFKSPCSHEK